MKCIVLAVLILLGACHRENNTTKMHPKIKSCKVYSSDFEILDNKNKGQLIQEFRFNKDGHVRELIRYGMQGEIISRFDIFGESSPFPVTDSPQFVDTTITSTELGLMGDIRVKETKHYNQSGKITDILVYNGNDSLVQKNTYEYNPEGYIVKDIYWDVELNVPAQVMNYEYQYQVK